MTIWFLVIYLSTNHYLNNATGGPIAIPVTFTSEEACKENGERLVKTIPKADWYHCDFAKQ